MVTSFVQPDRLMATLLVDTLDPVQWERWPVQLLPPEVAVFRYQLRPADQPWLHNLLQPAEHERTTRFRQTVDRQRFVAGRGWLRFLAGWLTHRPPQQIQLATGPAGKPKLIHPDGAAVGWQINVSHSGEWVLLAIGPVPVGVDVEWLRPNWPFQDLTASSFNVADQTAIQEADDPQRMFYTFWTRKESLFKATGQGLTNDFMTISVSKGVHQVKNGLLDGSGTWSIQSFTVTDEYVGAVACQGSPAPIRFFTLETASMDFLSSAFNDQ